MIRDVKATSTALVDATARRSGTGVSVRVRARAETSDPRRRYGSAVTFLAADVCPLPEDPMLAEAASALRDAGHWAEIVNAQWRTVYMTDDLRLGAGFMVERVPVPLGEYFFGTETITRGCSGARARRTSMRRGAS